jgi:hypothetical protein
LASTKQFGLDAWSPGHHDIAGNKTADKLAKRGAELGKERNEAERAGIKRRERMKSKGGRAKVFKVGMEEWEESNDEEWGEGVKAA